MSTPGHRLNQEEINVQRDKKNSRKANCVKTSGLKD